LVQVEEYLLHAEAVRKEKNKGRRIAQYLEDLAKSG
jgi:hypothetical protein